MKTLLSGTACGREQLGAAVEQREEAVGALHYHLEEFIDAGDAAVSDRDFGADTQLAVAWTLRNGLVLEQETFRSRGEALEAVGLRE